MRPFIAGLMLSFSAFSAAQETLYINAANGEFVAPMTSSLIFDARTCHFVVSTGQITEQQVSSLRQRLLDKVTAGGSDEALDRLVDAVKNAEGAPCSLASLVMDGNRYRSVGETIYFDADNMDFRGIIGLTSCSRASGQPITATGEFGQIEINGALPVARAYSPIIVRSSSETRTVEFFVHSLDGDIECDGIIERGVSMPERLSPGDGSNPGGPGNPSDPGPQCPIDPDVIFKSDFADSNC